ncbi:hypothetical protein CVT25_009972 [Psilocybe cyanescens]|uniref:Uncharacterized protein n=1 Tax=Psilocybe cyanescens TaxID=93625 RepID=A0A409XCU2_PSICY|nr:hypothetical protein CVT25_009972 [Psilocybe cyanescens]
MAVPHFTSLCIFSQSFLDSKHLTKRWEQSLEGINISLKDYKNNLSSGNHDTVIDDSVLHGDQIANSESTLPSSVDTAEQYTQGRYDDYMHADDFGSKHIEISFSPAAQKMLAELAGDLYNIAVHVVNDVINMAMSDIWSQSQTEVGEQDLLFHDFGSCERQYKMHEHLSPQATKATSIPPSEQNSTIKASTSRKAKTPLVKAMTLKRKASIQSGGSMTSIPDSLPEVSRGCRPKIISHR